MKTVVVCAACMTTRATIIDYIVAIAILVSLLWLLPRYFNWRDNRRRRNENDDA